MEPKTVEPVEPKDSQKTPDQVSIEQFSELQNELKSIKATQAGVDKANTELRELLKAKDLEIEATKKAAEDAKLSVTQKLEKDFKELQEKLAAKDAEAQHERFLSKGYKMAQDRNIGSFYVDNYKGDAEGLEAYLDNVQKDIEARVNKEITDKLGNGYKPKSGEPDPAKWDYSKHSFAENAAHDREEYLKRHPEYNRV